MQAAWSGAAFALLLACSALAQTSRFCPNGDNDVCYRINVPERTSQSGSGDIFYQISAPSSYQWIGLGQGSRMSGANIMVVYASSDGANVTLSPRLGKGHFEPEPNSAARVELLAGSGIKDGKITANVRCSSCSQWDGGQLNPKSTNSAWIWAARGGDPLKSDDPGEDINIHSENGVFNFDLVRATGGSSSNPFAVAAAPSPSASSSSSSGNEDEGSSSSGGETDKSRRILIAHGVLMSLAVLIFLPSGGILLRVVSGGAAVRLHLIVQSLAFFVIVAGVGLGIWTARETNLLNNYHPIIGLVVFCLIAVQPVGGLLHHDLYKKRDNQPTFVGVGHRWLGRILITLGIVNGGLGLNLADNTTGGKIAYGVVAGVVGVAYVGIVAGMTLKDRGANTRPAARPEK